MAKDSRTQEAPFKAPEKPVEASTIKTETEAQDYFNVGDRELKRGDKGEDVARLQRILGLKATGIYNEDTEAKVKYLQRIKNENETGLLSPEFARSLKF